jgi:hypothetical protein
VDTGLNGAPWCGDVDAPSQERLGGEAIADRTATLFLGCCLVVRYLLLALSISYKRKERPWGSAQQAPLVVSQRE